MTHQAGPGRSWQLTREACLCVLVNSIIRLLSDSFRFHSALAHRPDNDTPLGNTASGEGRLSSSAVVEPAGVPERPGRFRHLPQHSVNLTV